MLKNIASLTSSILLLSNEYNTNLMYFIILICLHVETFWQLSDFQFGQRTKMKCFSYKKINFKS